MHRAVSPGRVESVRGVGVGGVRRDGCAWDLGRHSSLGLYQMGERPLVGVAKARNISRNSRRSPFCEDAFHRGAKCPDCKPTDLGVLCPRTFW